MPQKPAPVGMKERLQEQLVRIEIYGAGDPTDSSPGSAVGMIYIDTLKTPNAVWYRSKTGWVNTGVTKEPKP